jgi:hypothetical protein
MKIHEYSEKIRKYVDNFHNHSGKDIPNRIHLSFIDEDIPIDSVLILAGRPRTAKTSFVLDFIARSSLLPILENEVFHNEIPPRKGMIYFIGQKEDIVLRRWYSIVNQHQIQEKKYTQYDFHIKDEYEKRIDKSKIYFQFLSSVEGIVERIEGDIKDNYPDYIAIDGIDNSLWDVVDEEIRNEKRERLYIDLLEIQNRIKRTFLITRNIDPNENYSHWSYRPDISHLKSNVIESKADAVLMLYRPDQFDIDVDEEGNTLKGIVVVKAVIYRYGEDRTELKWDISSGIPVKMKSE